MSIDYLKTLAAPYDYLGLTVGAGKNNPCPFHGGSDHMSIWESADGSILWKCHNPTGLEESSGSIIDLWMEAKALNLKDAIVDLKKIYIGDNETPTKIERPVVHIQKVLPKPTSKRAPELERIQYQKGSIPGIYYKKQDDSWGIKYFKDATFIDRVDAEYEGEHHCFAFARWDDEDGKFVRPLHYSDGKWGTGLGAKSGWKRPIWKLNELEDSDPKVVLVVEGEKCMHALQDAIDDLAFFDVEYEKYIVTSPLHAPSFADWSCLKHHRVIIMPDLDQPGIEKAKVISMAVPHDDVRVLWVEQMPDTIPEKGGYDVYDYIKEGKSIEKLLRRPGVSPDSMFAKEEAPVVMAAKAWNNDASIRNFTTERWEDENGKEHTSKNFVRMPQIVASIHNTFEDWPVLSGGRVTVPSLKEFGKLGATQPVKFLDKASDLSGWLHQRSDVYWTNSDVTHGYGEKVRPISYGDVLGALQDQARQTYDAVHSIPHEPKIDGILYSADVEAGKGHALRELISKLNPDTDYDRMLLELAILTPFWGGEAGKRPAFVIATDHGRGVGKSSTVQAISNIYGGALTIQEGEEFDQIMQRILTDSALSKRVLFIDNLKSSLDSGALEGAITLDTLSGKKMYVGEASVPNYYTWFVSANTPELSTDLASRSVVIKIGPKKDFNFEAWFAEFMSTRYEELLGDIKARIQEEPKCTLKKHSRFQSWDDTMLTRFECGNDLMELILDRRGIVDQEANDAKMTLEMIEQLISAVDLDPEKDKVFIPTDILTTSIAELWDIQHITPRGWWTHWNKIKIQPFFAGKAEKSRFRYDRGLMWNYKSDEETINLQDQTATAKSF